MILRTKITKAVLSAIEHLENSMKSIVEDDENLLEKRVWKASAEVEYALFLFSILRQDEQSPSWRVDLKSKKLEVAAVITSAQELLQKAKTSFENGNVLEAHKKMWMARGHLLKVQNFLERKHNR